MGRFSPDIPAYLYDTGPSPLESLAQAGTRYIERRRANQERDEQEAKDEPLRQLQEAMLRARAREMGIVPRDEQGPEGADVDSDFLRDRPRGGTFAGGPEGATPDLFEGRSFGMADRPPAMETDRGPASPGLPQEPAAGGPGLADQLRQERGRGRKILPGQFSAELGGFVRDPAAARFAMGLPEPTPTPSRRGGEGVVPLTDSFVLDPSQTPEAREAAAAEVERARAQEDQEGLRKALVGAGASPEEADLLVRQPSLIDNVLFRDEGAYQPSTMEEALEFEREKARIRRDFRIPRAGDDEDERARPNFNQAYDAIADLYSVRNDEGFVTGSALPPNQVLRLADQLANGEIDFDELPPAPSGGETFEPVPDVGEIGGIEVSDPGGRGTFFETGADTVRRFFGGGGEGEEAAAGQPTGTQDEGRLSPSEEAAVTEALEIAQDYPSVPDEQLRTFLEEEGYTDAEIDAVLKRR